MSGWQIFNWAVVALIVIVALITLRQSWVNLVQHRWARLSWDDFTLGLSARFVGQARVERARQTVATDPARLQWFGRYALVRGVLALVIALAWYLHFLR